MAKWAIRRVFKDANDFNYQLLINFRKSLIWDKLKEETVYSYSKDVYKFILFLQDKDIHTFEATAELLQEYLDTLDVSAGRKLKIVSAINLFYKHLKKRHRIKKISILDFDTSELRNEFRRDEYIRKEQKKE